MVIIIMKEPYNIDGVVKNPIFTDFVTFRAHQYWLEFDHMRHWGLGAMEQPAILKYAMLLIVGLLTLRVIMWIIVIISNIYF